MLKIWGKERWLINRQELGGNLKIDVDLTTTQEYIFWKAYN